MALEMHWNRAHSMEISANPLEPESDFIGCPQCGEISVYYERMREVSVCTECGHTFDDVVKQLVVIVQR